MAPRTHAPGDYRSFISRAFNKLLALPAFILKALYILPFLLFGLWLVQMLYFPHLEAKKIIEAATHKGEDKNVFHTILEQLEPVGRGHFHMVDEYITQLEHNPPLCLTCHGTYPHSKEKKVRSILNFHTGFIACAVCHARQESGDKHIDFSWVNHETGKIETKVKG